MPSFLKKSYSLLISFSLIFILLLNNIKLEARPNIFQKKNSQKIKIPSQQEQIALWKDTETPTIYRQFNIQKPEDIKFYVKNFHDIQLNHINQEPSYNKGYDNNLSYTLKNPDDKLVGVYLHSRDNPFKITYQAENDKHTVEDLKPQTIAIDTFNEFFDVNKMPITNNVNLHWIKDKIQLYEGDSEARKQEIITDYISDYLYQKKITQNYMKVNYQCYNPHQKSSMTVPLPTNLKNNNRIHGIYFDDGFRVLSNPDTNVEDCQKLANGAKNIYVFQLNEQCKTINHITYIIYEPSDILEILKNQHNIDTNLNADNPYLYDVYDSCIPGLLFTSLKAQYHYVKFHHFYSPSQNKLKYDDVKKASRIVDTIYHFRRLEPPAWDKEFIVNNRQEAFNILAQNGIHNVHGSGEYNAPFSKEVTYSLLNKPSDVDFIYLDNCHLPYVSQQVTYPVGNYTIENFKNNFPTIRRIFIFKYPEVRIHRYTIDNKDQINTILQKQGLKQKSNHISDTPSFNDTNDMLNRSINNPPSNLAGVYIIRRPNWSCQLRESGSYTLNNLTNMRGKISDIHIFHKSQAWLEREWINQQSVVQTHTYEINNRQEGFNKLSSLGISNVYGSGDYNSANSNYLGYSLSNKPSNLEFIYIKARSNPFGRTYSTGYDLDYYKNQKATISDIYIFHKSQKFLEDEWLAKQPNVNIKPYTIDNREEGYKILEQNGININRSRSYNYYSMNYSGFNYIYWAFDKTNNENVDFIYCVKRDNPLGKKYEEYKTLDYYKQQKLTIQTLYIFHKSQAWLEREWLANQPNVNIKTYNIINRQEGFDKLNQLGISGVYGDSYSYNAANEKKIYWSLKNKPDNIDFCYFVARPNPFNKTYPASDDTYDLDYFKQQKATIQTLYIFKKRTEQEWTNQQSSVQTHTYEIDNRQEGFNKLSSLGISGVNGSGDYNSSNSNYLGYSLSNKPSNLEFIYIKARNNPFGRTYSTGYDLDYYKNQKGTISDIYIFNKPKTKIHEYTINNRQEGFDILAKNGISGVYDDSDSYNAPNEKLISYALKKKPKNIDFCYLVPRPNKTYPYDDGKYDLEYFKQQHETISDIYIFYNPPVNIKPYTINNREEGYKILEQNGINIDRNRSYDDCSINNSGFNCISADLKKTNNENVDFIYCINRDNKFYLTYQILDYFKNQHDTFSDLYIFNKSTNYKTQAQINYDQALQTWKDQCYFKQGHQYNSEYIREKLGRSDKKVYCLNSNNIIDIVPSLGTINGINFISAYWFYDYTLDYKYITGYISDDWYFTQPGKEPAYIPSFNALSKDVLGLGTSVRMGQIFFDTYADTTPPPKKSDYGL